MVNKISCSSQALYLDLLSESYCEYDGRPQGPENLERWNLLREYYSASAARKWEMLHQLCSQEAGKGVVIWFFAQTITGARLCTGLRMRVTLT